MTTGGLLRAALAEGQPSMSTDSRLSSLLDRWQQSRQGGTTLEELCRDCPELRADAGAGNFSLPAPASREKL
jgi:hypothetical protein